MEGDEPDARGGRHVRHRCRVGEVLPPGGVGTEPSRPCNRLERGVVLPRHRHHPAHDLDAGVAQTRHGGAPDGRIVDVETGTTWDPVRGIAGDGPLAGEVLDQLPGFTSFERDFLTFHPQGRIVSRR